ncbi:membrane-bound O-acyltransferase family MBOAT [Leptospira inadai serovar Lyme str. 10]|uniref:Membrane-bound O-acyltransferase family MBOAT n=2 Tax=Leptospira inadai serovar Lyme TaxID=293084 RepID=V6H9N7_9LEPT|nr:MBOAT family O-acyltransferase [Leptospira inadai]EQA35742.1 membrane-bound O-acyltransferase family MBOAT [Leptospira inadai serovar Lyme str. 10]PNV77016.1 MBOAT family protein [Leptospira inadai serovar Lyme]
MNFTTPLYTLFFVFLFLLRWLLPRFRFLPEWIPFPFLLVGSYLFYFSWSPKFGSLILATTILDYSVGKAMGFSSPGRRRLLLLLSLSGNLTVLGFFKYFGFFVENGNALLSALGLHSAIPSLKVVLPVGISFYTFQSLSYTIDVYRKEIQPEQSFWNYALFLSFFPQLVAGPIVPAREFLPQLKQWVAWENLAFREGVVLLLVGSWKKAVLADNIAILPDALFQSPAIVSQFYAWVGVFAYALQIYFDFSGYTDIALGSALLLGFRLTENFRMPYLASSFSDFWKRWHISLSSWLKNYLYISLGGNRKGEFRTYLNLLITMLLGGLWHGASWNFVVWGGIHGALLGLERGFGHFFKRKGAILEIPKIVSYAYRILVVLTIVLVWVFFRSPSWEKTEIVFAKLFFGSGGINPGDSAIRLFFLCGLLFVVSTWIGQRDEASGVFRSWVESLPGWAFAGIASLGFLFAVLLSAESQPFLYFVF